MNAETGMRDAGCPGLGRREFIKGAMSATLAALFGSAKGVEVSPVPPEGAPLLEDIAGEDGREAFQREIDAVTPQAWAAYDKCGLSLDEATGARMRAELPALQRYEDAFDKVLAEIGNTEVTGRPAVWLVYNMGVVVKTPKSLFAVDLRHRRAEVLAPKLDFALITHNHGDHFTEDFYRAMNGTEKKTVVSNFKDNYGAQSGGRNAGGYTRAVKTFEFGDVRVRTTPADHNAYLVDFTTVFEITIGDFTIYHSGDCGNAEKLKPLCPNPDLWIFHPRCGMKCVDGAKAVNPKLAVVTHLNELGHAKDRWRWTWAQGGRDRRKLEDAGYKAVVPLWGERIC